MTKRQSRTWNMNVEFTAVSLLVTQAEWSGGFLLRLPMETDVQYLFKTDTHSVTRVLVYNWEAGTVINSICVNETRPF